MEYNNHIHVFISVYSPETQTQSFFDTLQWVFYIYRGSQSSSSESAILYRHLSVIICLLKVTSSANYRSNTTGLKTTLIYYYIKLLRRTVREPVFASGRRIFHPILINWIARSIDHRLFSGQMLCYSFFNSLSPMMLMRAQRNSKETYF